MGSVISEENPADVGIPPGEVIHHNLWWNGPSWLKEDPSKVAFQDFCPPPPPPPLHWRLFTPQALQACSSKSERKSHFKQLLHLIKPNL